MPKAAMHKDCQSMSGKHHIRFSWQVSTMQPETVAETVQQASHRQFGLGVFAMDGSHDCRSLSRHFPALHVLTSSPYARECIS